MRRLVVRSQWWVTQERHLCSGHRFSEVLQLLHARLYSCTCDSVRELKYVIWWSTPTIGTLCDAILEFLALCSVLDASQIFFKSRSGLDAWFRKHNLSTHVGIMRCRQAKGSGHVVTFRRSATCAVLKIPNWGAEQGPRNGSWDLVDRRVRIYLTVTGS